MVEEGENVGKCYIIQNCSSPSGSNPLPHIPDFEQSFEYIVGGENGCLPVFSPFPTMISTL